MRAIRPVDPRLPKQLITVGDHIRFCRIKRRMIQGEVAELIGVTTDTVTNWELNRSEPQVKYMPRIISFLNYAPVQTGEPNNIGEQLKLYRIMHGISIKRLAKMICVDVTTILRIEQHSKGKIFQKTIQKINSLF